MSTEIGTTSVPDWDGQMISFRDYGEACYWYVKGLRKADRALAVPRLIRRLPRAAKQLIRRLNKHKLAARDGLEYMLSMIQEQLLVPQVQDVGRYISGYFESLNIRRNESIQEYCTRERLVYTDMCRAIKALTKAKAPKSATTSRKTSVAGDEEWPDYEEDEQSGFDEVWPDTVREDRGRAKGKGKTGKGTRPSSAKSEWSIVDDDADDFGEDDYVEELLPVEVQGYFLLRRAGLTKIEEQQVMSSAGNSLKREAVETALRALFWDRRNQTPNRHGHFSETEPDDSNSGYWGEYDSWPSEYGHNDEEWTSQGFYSDFGDEDMAGLEDVSLDELDEEDKTAFLEAADSLKQGMTMLKTGRRTMSQARALMKDIRVGRGFKGKGKGKGFGKGGKLQSKPALAALLDAYYGKGGKGGKGGGKGSKGKRFGKSGSSTPRTATADDVCFGCGDRGHFSRDCPHSKSGHLAIEDWSQSDPSWQSWDGYGYVAFRVDFEDPEKLSAFTATETAQNTWLAPLDSGASDSFAGQKTLEKFDGAYQQKFGHAPAFVMDTSERPTYTFGDGENKQSQGKAMLQTWKHGAVCTLGVHSIPGRTSGAVPILVGNGSLQKMGAVVDFETGYAVFKDINPGEARQLPRTANGHLAIDLFKDLADQGSFVCEIGLGVSALESLAQASALSKTVQPNALGSRLALQRQPSGHMSPASSSKSSSGY